MNGLKDIEDAGCFGSVEGIIDSDYIYHCMLDVIIVLNIRLKLD